MQNKPVRCYTRNQEVMPKVYIWRGSHWIKIRLLDYKKKILITEDWVTSNMFRVHNDTKILTSSSLLLDRVSELTH